MGDFYIVKEAALLSGGTALKQSLLMLQLLNPHKKTHTVMAMKLCFIKKKKKSHTNLLHLSVTCFQSNGTSHIETLSPFVGAARIHQKWKFCVAALKQQYVTFCLVVNQLFKKYFMNDTEIWMLDQPTLMIGSKLHLNSSDYRREKCEAGGEYFKRPCWNWSRTELVATSR